MDTPVAKERKVFVPARDWAVSLAFYSAIGCVENWRHSDGLAELQFVATKFLVQDYYHEAWAENVMMQFIVEDAETWNVYMKALVDSGRYGAVRVTPLNDEPWGQRVVYVWDPCGVLLHVAQLLATS